MKFLALLTTFLLASCGKNIPSPASLVEQDKFRVVEEVNGIFKAELHPLNSLIEAHLSGAVTVARERDEFIVDVYFTNGKPNVFHPQHIHVGKRCPTAKDDTNNDGFIDAEEAFRVVGNILIPIDDDLSSQWMGLGTYPMTDSYGSYYWSKATSFKKLLSDLYEEDINLDDDLIKLTKGTPLSVDGHAVLIMGAHSEDDLPYTISGRKHLTRHQSLPVACGILEKVLTPPGVIDRDDPISL